MELRIFIIINLIFNTGRSMNIITFIIEPNDTVVPKNGVANVKCRVNQDNAQYSWFLYNDQSRSDEHITQSQHMWVDKAGLLILREHPSVVGRYRCKAVMTKVGIVVSRLFRIDVADLYFIKMTQRQLGSGQYKIGDVAVLICPFWTVPPSEVVYKWYLKTSSGRRLIQGSQSSVLHDRGKALEVEVDSASFGDYFCEAAYKKYGLEKTSPVIEITSSSYIYDPKLNDQLSWVAQPVESLLLDSREMYKENMKLIDRKGTLIIREGTHTLELLCAAISESGEVKIIWTKDNIILDKATNYHNKFSYMITGQGTLVLRNITAQNEGQYTCKASIPSKNKQIETLVKLIVRKKLRFTIKPAPIVIGDVNKEILLSCQLNEGESDTLITWRKNGELISSSNFLQQNHGFMRISRLLDSDQGVFQCLADDEFSSIQAVVLLKINQATNHVSRDNRPLSVKNLRVKAISYRTLNLSWNHDNEDFETILHYEITLIDLSNLSTENNKITFKVDRLESSVLVKDLIPDSFYRIYVSAVNGSGVSYPAIIKSSPRVLSKPPLAIPSKLFVTDIGSGVASIHWKAPPWDKMDGEFLGFRLMLSGLYGIFIKSLDVDKNARVVQLTDLVPETKYFVTVQVLSRGGQGPLSKKVSFESCRFDNKHDITVVENEKTKLSKNDINSFNDNLQLKPPGEITKWKVRGRNTSLDLQWSHPNTGGQIKRYKIKWGKVYPGPNEVILQYPASSYIINNLEVQTQYMIKVIPINDIGDGKELLFSKFTGNADNKKIPIPLNLGLKSIGMDSAIISWDDPSKDLSNTRLYQVRYNILGKESVLTYLKNSTENNVQIIGLIPSTSYEYSVRSGDIMPSSEGDYLEKEWMWSEWSLKETFSTVGEKPKHGPQDFTIITTNKPNIDDHDVFTKVLLTWASPYDKDIRTYDEILGYIILFTENPSLDQDKWHAQIIPRDQFSSEIRLSGREKIYYFRVGCRTTHFQCPLSRIIIYKTADAYGQNYGILPIPKDYYYSLDIPKKYLNVNPINGLEEVRENVKVISRDGVWLIVGGIFGGLILITMIFIIICLCYRRRSKPYFIGYKLGMKSPNQRNGGIGLLLSNQSHAISNGKISPHFPTEYSREANNPELFSNSDLHFGELENDNQDNESIRFASVSQHHLAPTSTCCNMFNATTHKHPLRRSHPQMAYYPEMAANAQNFIKSTTVINPLININSITIQNELSGITNAEDQFPSWHTSDLDANIQLMQQQNLNYPFSNHLYGPMPICSSSCLQPIHLSPHMLNTELQKVHNTISYSNTPRVNASELASHTSSEDIRPQTLSPRVSDSDASQYYGSTSNSTIKSHKNQCESIAKKVNINSQRTSDMPKNVIERGLIDNDARKGFCTEELSQEMANLEGLMKDLTAITQKEFEC